MLERPESGTAILPHAEADIERVLVDRDTIAARVKALAEAIEADLARLPEDAEVVLLPVMTGSIIFVADLIRHLPHKMRVGVVEASSYPGPATAPQSAPVLGPLPPALVGRHVIVVDDILDSGTTLRHLRAAVAEHGAVSTKTCVLLRKQRPSALATPCEYVGFDIPDAFVVGYGLDYDGYYRNLPDIGVLKPDVR